MTMTHIEEVLDIAGLSEVAYARPELAGGLGEIWDITLPNEETTIRLCHTDGEVDLYIFTGGRAQIEDGHARFIRQMAAPDYVAMMLDQIVADYS